MEHRTRDLITTAAAAALLGVSPQALYKWRRENRGPQPYRICGTYRYDRNELLAFLEASRPDQSEEVG